MTTRNRFLVTGCGRSGTQYVAQLLDSAGLQVGHERVFKPQGAPGGGFRVRGTDVATLSELYAAGGWGLGWDGDVSWYSVPFLADIPGDWAIVHLVRNPIHIIRSWMALGYWRMGPASKSVRVVMHALDWPPGKLDDHLGCSIAYWLGWNQLIREAAESRPIPIVKLEDVSNNPAVASDLTGLLGHPVPPETMAVVFKNEMPATVGSTAARLRNRRSAIQHPTDMTIRWSTLSTTHRAMIAPMAETLGYTLTDLESA